MRRPLTSAQLAQFAEIGEDRIDEYRSRGLIDPDRDGEMDDWDVLRLRILMHYESLGRSMDEIEKAIRDGSTSVIYSDLLWGDADAFVVPEQIAEELGVPLEDIEALLRAIGLTGSIPRSDLKFFEMMKSLVDGGLPMKLLLEVARVYGDSLRRLAQTEVRMIRDVVAEPGRSSLLKDRAQSERLQAVQEVLEPVLEP
ncbi:MAG TPA: adenylate cyclase regulatory domain-containing protein, partial [Actinomycetota bacterium]|nr:adenylate cyclase regulatory domain-containing protein [Actinomycetota bacterium]